MAKEENSLITKILAEEIKDSRGNPTIKVTVWAGGISGNFSVPSGVSTGVHEAHELRDADGKGVKTAIEKVNSMIAPALAGKNVLSQKEIDGIMIELDGTQNKDNLGANSMVGVSIACAKAAAKLKKQEVYQYLRTLCEIKSSRNAPYLFMNLLEGGKHSASNLAFQEYHVVPETENTQEAVDIGNKIQNTLTEILLKNLDSKSAVLGDEGGFVPQTNDVRKPLLFLAEAVNKNNLQNKVRFALDVAASSFYRDGHYQVASKDISSSELMNIYDSLIKEFNLFSIEDPFNEEDFDNFKKLKDKNKNLLVVGDDLTVSNRALLEQAIDKGSINAIIIKPNQIGTLSEMFLTMQLARANGIEIIVSHRGRETNDDFIADLAFAFGCFGLKTGSPLKPERMVKYQRLIKIARSINQ
ncbi:MAG: phosphopyruvate hydratase [Patescibacteria group bacterium]